MNVVSLLKTLVPGQTAFRAVDIPGWAYLNQRRRREICRHLLNELEWKQTTGTSLLRSAYTQTHQMSSTYVGINGYV